jgi:phage gpG-like protein
MTSLISLPIKIEGADAVAAKLALAPDKIKAAVRRAVEASAAGVMAGAKAKVSDDILHVKTGRLRRSIHYSMGGTDETPSAVIGTNVEYAAIHEFGGQTRAHVIEALNAKVLAFKGPSGDMVFAKRVHHPGSHMPERSFLRSTLGEQAQSIKDRITLAIKGSLP